MKCNCAPVLEPYIDSKKNNCPPFMSDGRVFTDYRGKCSFYTGSSSYNMRQQYIQKAEEMIKNDRERALQNAFCAPCFDYNSNGTQLPEAKRQVCTKTTCTFTNIDHDGIGTRRGNDETWANRSGVPLFPIEGVATNNNRYATFGEITWI
jgi:hypothetical protein